MTAAGRRFSLPLAGEADTIRLGGDLALVLKPGDCLAMSGDLGAGKSTLARAFLRAMAQDPQLEVPSPTFTLVQLYDLRIPVAHFDFYRLGDAAELDELGFDEALDTGICLVEWPEMAEAALPATTIWLRLEHDGDGRRAILTATTPQADRIARSLAIRDFLIEADLGLAPRRHLTGDASVRAYETVERPEGGRLILMDWPRQPEGPPVLDGKPYPKVAHLAEDAYPFVALSQYLRGRGFAAPAVYRADYEQGILLIEDLGSDGVLDGSGEPIAERYLDSVAFLAALHATPMNGDLPVSTDHVHHVPDFDRTAMMMEARLLVDWHLLWARGTVATEAEKVEYQRIWNSLVNTLSDAETNLLLRDFHSPNIIWRDSATGLQRIGLIDFQDAMIGPTAYDLASIIQDARVDVPTELAQQMLQRYLQLRRAQGRFDEAAFLQSFAIMAAQRACKLAGLWVRLMQRDHKPAYMKHMPRTLHHLSVAFRHPVLHPLRDWCAAVGIGRTES